MSTNDFLKIGTEFLDPEARDIEIVERKGLGHPDTLADALAERVSVEYSNHCLERFGAVLHHNVDKLYIGAGHFRTGFGRCEMIKPVQVRINGRMSDSYADQRIDIDGLIRTAVLPYLLSVLPYLQENQVEILANATQHTKNKHWFSPKSMDDLPEHETLRANDTSVCISHWPMTTSERLAYELEQYFWKESAGLPVPKFKHFGQDIKVMVFRNKDVIDVTVCLPVISTRVKSLEESDSLTAAAEGELNSLASKIVAGKGYYVSVHVNPHQRLYMLGIGSCIECGEEGCVGRGNSNSGIISAFRPHSVEASAGKNPVYHTGRVLGFLTLNLAKAIYRNLGVKCTVLAMTKNGGSLIPPFLLSIDASSVPDGRAVEGIVASDFLEVDYLKCLLGERCIK